jgi:hypothetical protein
MGSKVLRSALLMAVSVKACAFSFSEVRAICEFADVEGLLSDLKLIYSYNAFSAHIASLIVRKMLKFKSFVFLSILSACASKRLKNIYCINLSACRLYSNLTYLDSV